MIILCIGILSLIGSLLNFAKDIDKFTKRGKMVFVLTIVCLFGALLIKEFQTKRSSQESAAKINQLTSMIQAEKDLLQAEKDTHDREREARERSLVAVYDQLTQLKSEVTTEKLQAKLDATQQALLQTREELGSTQRALNPPKAQFSFSIFTKGLLRQGHTATPIKEISVTEKDGAIVFDVTAINISSIPAINGELKMRICDNCIYVNEPANWNSLAATPQDRFIHFNMIGAHTFWEPVTISLASPNRCMPHPIDVAFKYDCQNCKVEQWHMIRINSLPEQPCIRLMPK